MSTPVDTPDWANPSTGMNVVTTVVNAQVMNPSTTLGPFDLTAYNSALLWTAPDTGGIDLAVIDAASGQVITEVTTPADALGNRVPPILVPLSGTDVTLQNNGPDAITVTLAGSTRNVPEVQPFAQYLDVDSIAVPSAAYSGTVNLGYGRGTGEAFTEFTVSGTLAGIYQVATKRGAIQIADTSEMHISPSGGGKTLFKPWIAPRTVWQMQFVVTTAATGLIRAQTVYR